MDNQSKVINGLKIDINDSKNYEIVTQFPEMRKAPISDMFNMYENLLCKMLY